MLLIGIDQSPKKHDICITELDGRQLARGEVGNTLQGFQWIHEQCQRLGIPPRDCLSAQESAHSLLVDFLLDHGYQVYIVPGRAVNRYRDRHRQSRSRSDQGDAAVLADILRTDRHRYMPLTADTPCTRQICSLVRLLSTLKRNVVRVSNQLRDLLWRYYPIGADLFSKLDQPLTCAFIQAYPTPQAIQPIALADFEAFCHQHHYWHKVHIARCYEKLKSAETFASSEVANAYAAQAQSLARVLLFLVHERAATEKTLTQTFQQHPDAHIFASLPGAGAFLAPALLSKFRDCRACDREFRWIATEFARCSISDSSWAAGYFAMVRPRVEKISHAYRCLANRWIAIIWRLLWTDRVEYDEALHLRNRFINRVRR